jgi:hypothetical protein
MSTIQLCLSPKLRPCPKIPCEAQVCGHNLRMSIFVENPLTVTLSARPLKRSYALLGQDSANFSQHIINAVKQISTIWLCLNPKLRAWLTIPCEAQVCGRNLRMPSVSRIHLLWTCQQDPSSRHMHYLVRTRLTSRSKSLTLLCRYQRPDYH